MTITRRRQPRAAVGAAVGACAVLLGVAHTAPAQAPAFSLAGAAGGVVTAVALAEGHEWVAIGPHVLDLYPDPPLRSEVMPDVVEDMAVDRHQALVAVRLGAGGNGDIVLLRGEGEAVVPYATLAGADIPSPYHGMSLAGSRLFVSAGGSLLGIDVVPGTLSVGTAHPGVRGGPAALAGRVAVGSSAGGLLVLDDEPTGFTETGRVPGPLLDDVEPASDPTLIRVLGLARGAAPGLQMVSYQLDPGPPRELGQVPAGPGAVVGTSPARTLAAWAGSGAVQAYDFTGPLPFPGGTVTTHVPLAVAVGDGGLVGGVEGVTTLDLVNPAAPVVADVEHWGAGIVKGLAAGPGDTVVAAHGAGIAVFSAGLTGVGARGWAERPGARGGLLLDETQGSAAVAVVGSAALVASLDTGLVIYEVANPDAPRVVGAASAGALGERALAVAGYGTRAYVGGPTGIARLDVANPAAPQVLDRTGVGGRVNGLALDGSGARLLAATTVGLRIANTSQTPLGFVPVAAVERSEAVAARGAVAAVVEGAKLVLLDLVPAEPQVLARVPLPDPGLAVAFGANEVFVSTDDEVLGIDLARPEGPLRHVSVPPGSAVALAAVGGGVVAGGGFLGVRYLVSGALPPTTTPTATSSEPSPTGTPEPGEPTNTPTGPTGPALFLPALRQTSRS